VDSDPNYLHCKVHISLNFIFLVYLFETKNDNEVNFTYLNLFCWNFQLVGLSNPKNSAFVTSKKIHYKFFYPSVFIYASLCQFLDDIVSMFLKGVQVSSSYG
jgi:hypothetical protein